MFKIDLPLSFSKALTCFVVTYMHTHVTHKHTYTFMNPQWVFSRLLVQMFNSEKECLQFTDNFHSIYLFIRQKRILFYFVIYLFSVAFSFFHVVSCFLYNVLWMVYYTDCRQSELNIQSRRDENSMWNCLNCILYKVQRIILFALKEATK